MLNPFKAWLKKSAADWLFQVYLSIAVLAGRPLCINLYNWGIEIILELGSNSFYLLPRVDRFHLLAYVKQVVLNIFEHIDFTYNEFPHTIYLYWNPT